MSEIRINTRDENGVVQPVDPATARAIHDATKKLHAAYAAKSQRPAANVIANLGAAMSEGDRLGSMSNRDLVAECLNSDASDYLCVIEMMNRLDPEWSRRPEPSSMRIGR